MMSVVGHPPPPFFRRGPAPLARFVFFVTVSLALLVVDLRLKYLESLRQAIAVITYPLQQIAYAPVQGLREVGAYFSTVSAMQDENSRFKRQQVELAGTLLRQHQLDQENQRLRALLEMKQRQPAKGLVADIVYGARDPFSRKVFIDKGSQSGIAGGQAVVDEVGLIGQVTRVYPLQSEVTLISDKDQAVPVQVMRNGLRAVVFGSGGGPLELRFLAADADVQNGDVLVTSGLDGVYLAGLPVAKVVRVERDNVYAFARILCAPVAGVEQHGLVLVLGPRESMPPPAAQANPARTTAAKAKKAKHME
jgi:rod shape-determining protein MreC